MKLFRFRDNGNVKPGIVDQSGISRDASSIVSDWSGESLSDNFIQNIDNSKLSDLPQLNDVDYAPCVGDIGKFMVLVSIILIMLKKLAWILQLNQSYL